jgi:hypothetical protein
LRLERGCVADQPQRPGGWQRFESSDVLRLVSRPAVRNFVQNKFLKNRHPRKVTGWLLARLRNLCTRDFSLTDVTS